MTFKRTVGFFLLLFSFCACQPRAAARLQENAALVPVVSDGGARVVQEVHRGHQTICRVDGRDFPPSYLASDISKPGVPTLDKHRRAELMTIARYVSSRTLRFQTVNGTFLIYDASLGPCMLAAPGYWVLNAKRCNVYFMPADAWNGPGAVPECWGAPRPWVRGDGGDRRVRPSGDHPWAGISKPAP